MAQLPEFEGCRTKIRKEGYPLDKVSSPFLCTLMYKLAFGHTWLAPWIPGRVCTPVCTPSIQAVTLTCGVISVHMPCVPPFKMWSPTCSPFILSVSPQEATDPFTLSPLSSLSSIKFSMKALPAWRVSLSHPPVAATHCF